MSRISTLLAGTTLAIFAATGTAQAQTVTAAAQASATTAADTSIDDSENIIVTARTREERLQDVPIAVTAVTAETLERQHITQVRDIAQFAPGLNITSDAVGRAFMSIRGVGTTLIDTVQPGVGIFVDGIYQTNTSYLNNPVVDVARIEVLKGPQGTLFGNNTLGGAINVITRQPTDTFQGRFAADYAPDDNYQTYSGSISGPLIEGVLRGRLAVSYHSADGFSKNTLAGGDARPIEDDSVNGTLLWNAPQGAQITLNGYYNRVDGAQTAYSSPSGPTDYVDDVQTNFNSVAEYIYSGANLKGVFDVTNNTQMTAMLAYDERQGKASGDGDFGPVPFVHVVDGHNGLYTYTGDLRFDTHWNDRFSTLLGFFANYSQTKVSIADILTLPTGLAPPFPATVDVPTLSTQNSDTSAQAIYFNAFYNLTDTLEFSAGLRYDHQQVNNNNILPVAAHTQYEANQLEPRVTLTEHWTPNHMSYASISRGFRGGGANANGAPNPIYQGDSVWTYEIGDKFSTEDHVLTLNTAIYYNDYSHYIGQNSLTPALIAVNLNTGPVTSYGFEAESTWRPSSLFALQGGLAYNHSRITSDEDYFAVTTKHLPSDRILFQPDWTAFITPSLTFDMGNDSDIRFDITAAYKGERRGSSLSETVSPVLEAYTLVNSNLTYERANWSIGLWATNLTDERYYESYLDSSLLSAFGFSGPLVHNLGITGDRRRVGVRLTARF
ncbi:MAG: TonB-dependent receptor [Terricaulis sp.]